MVTVTVTVTRRTQTRRRPDEGRMGLGSADGVVALQRRGEGGWHSIKLSPFYIEREQVGSLISLPGSPSKTKLCYE